MNATTLVMELCRRGVQFTVEGAHIRYRAPKGLITGEMKGFIARHKAEIRSLIYPWPQECLESERRFGRGEARLYPLIDKKVMTSAGPGLLRRVFSGSIGVRLDDDPDRVTFFEEWNQVWPLQEEVSK